MARISKTLGFLRRMSRLQSATIKLASRALKPAASPVSARSVPTDRVTERTGFGSNPGALRMFVFAPPQMPAGAPLVVVLHGCGQDAASFATNSGWIALARELRFPLLLPQQVTANHANGCFNWYRPGDTGRGKGEAMSIRQMIARAAKDFDSDRRRIFILGLSAGGAMTAAMLAAYPAVFAGGAIVAGMPVGAASGSMMALHRMRRSDPFGHQRALVAAVHAVTSSSARRIWPRLTIWQGLADRTVDPGNAELLAAQWAGVHGQAAAAMTDEEILPGIRCRRWGSRARVRAELWTMAGLAHAYPIDATADGGRAGPWVREAGISATRRIAEFWGL
ncbi:alpha/beta hydrolase family esterase [Roseococcus sp.]|uniref:extracellular catalytic domain type 1 short-chain-length polyhydroxyalkanoate depolymerase n=1 Tax=Roseococcus sp. TaxID=2109646 RepID=UPI003BAB210F